MIVKICGLMSPVDATYANMAGPDMVGMVFHPASRRCVTIEQAIAIKEALGSITTVGVFVDADIRLMEKLVGEGIVDMIQVHGCTDECFRKAKDVGVPIIRAYVVKTREDVEQASACEADYVMLDAGYGDGKSLNPSLLEDANFDYILSGGLTPSNILNAVRRLHPYGVDVSSGVETDGMKDPTKMTSFVYAARSNFEPLLEGEARKGFRLSVQLGTH